VEKDWTRLSLFYRVESAARGAQSGAGDCDVSRGGMEIVGNARTIDSLMQIKS
jgi:hypothetical protein